MKQLIAGFGLLLLANGWAYGSEPLKAVQLYSQDELINLINKNQHLARVKADDCQLVQDIEARADTLKIPAYQFLWGDMLAWGVCVEKEPERGIEYMQMAADQGLAAALEQLGRYYANGILVQKDPRRGLIFLREASALGNQNAQIQMAELLINGLGNPMDYEDVYHWLYNSVTADQVTHRKIANCLAKLETLMHPKAVRAAKRPLDS